MFRRIFWYGFTLIFCQLVVPAQINTYYRLCSTAFDDAMQAVKTEDWSTAQYRFKMYMQTCNEPEKTPWAKYYTAYAALKLNQKDGAWQLREFAEYTTSLELHYRAIMDLGRYYFNLRKFDKALPFLDSIPALTVNANFKNELTFKRSYALLMLNKLDAAQTGFFKLRQDSSEYSKASVFYYAYIAYVQNHYGLARQLFKQVESLPAFKQLIPNYILQMDYAEGNYESVIANGIQLLSDSDNVQAPEQLKRLIGESYFHLKNYNQAISYLKDAGALDPPLRYMLAFSLYKTSQWNAAIEQWEPLLSTFEQDSSYTSNIMYHLADCYVNSKAYIKAQYAFEKAKRYSKDSLMIENASYNHAKLTYLLATQFQSNAEQVLKTYITTYSNSIHAQEIERLLVSMYQKSKDYDRVIAYLGQLPAIDPILKEVYQKAWYSKACVTMNNGKALEAEHAFKQAEDLHSNPELTALSVFWRGELAYHNGDFQTAVDLWKRFFLTEGASSTAVYNECNYHLGYAYFKRNDNGDIKAANFEFRKFIESFDSKARATYTQHPQNAFKYADALLRIADTYLLSKDIKSASQYYETAYGISVDKVYALYQWAICNGVLKQHSKKIELLKQIETQYSKSEYYLPAIIEIAETYYKNLEQYNDAIAYYKRIESQYPNSESERKAWIQLGNLFYAIKNDDMAFAYFDKYVQIDPSSEISKNIQDVLRKILEDRQNVEYMESYFKALGNPLTEQQVENALYRQAYMLQEDTLKHEAAALKWTAYIEKFPEGKYISEALSNRADFKYRKQQQSEALADYLKITQLKRNIYTEPALAKAAYIDFKLKSYTEALALFIKLDSLAENPQNSLAARLGIMRCAFLTAQYSIALDASKRVLLHDKVNANQQAEAQFIKARSLFETGSLDDARNGFTAIVKTSKNITGAESYYWIAKIYFIEKDWKNVEKTITKLIHFPYTNDEWNQNGMLLLSKSYFEAGDIISSKIILESILKDNPTEDIKQQALALQAQIQSVELQNQQPPSSPESTKDSELNLELNEAQQNP